MKAITIKQPWASLIVHGIKDIENRTWACPWKYIGHRVLIHASGKPVEMRNPNSVFTKAQWDSLPVEFQRKIICAEGIVNSAIIGSVEIIGCSINHPSKWAEKSDDSRGYYGVKQSRNKSKKIHVITLIHRHFFDLISFISLTVKNLFLVHFCCTFVTRNKIIFITLTSEKPEWGHKIETNKSI